MIVLIDTHTFLWFVNDNVQLSQKARAIVQNPDNAILVSMASVWEMAIKVSIGKLAVPLPFDHYIETELAVNNFGLLPVRTSHIAALADMPFHHRDPFDRMLIAQAQVEAIPILSTDQALDVYGVERIW